MTKKTKQNLLDLGMKKVCYREELYEKEFKVKSIGKISVRVEISAMNNKPIIKIFIPKPANTDDSVLIEKHPYSYKKIEKIIANLNSYQK